MIAGGRGGLLIGLAPRSVRAADGRAYCDRGEWSASISLSTRPSACTSRMEYGNPVVRSISAKAEPKEEAIAATSSFPELVPPSVSPIRMRRRCTVTSPPFQIDIKLLRTTQEGSPPRDARLAGWRSNAGNSGPARRVTCRETVGRRRIAAVAGALCAVVIPGISRVGAARNPGDLGNAKVSRLPVGFGDWNPLAGDEPRASEDCRIGRLPASEGKKPAAVISTLIRHAILPSAKSGK